MRTGRQLLLIAIGCVGILSFGWGVAAAPDSGQKLLTGKAAMGDWITKTAGVR